MTQKEYHTQQISVNDTEYELWRQETEQHAKQWMKEIHDEKRAEEREKEQKHFFLQCLAVCNAENERIRRQQIDAIYREFI